MPHPGFIWTVYPSSSSAPMVSLGHTSDEAKARAHVESELGHVDDSAWGVVIGPGGQHDVCRRAIAGGFAWRPLWSDAERSGGPGA